MIKAELKIMKTYDLISVSGENTDSVNSIVLPSGSAN